MNFYQHDWFSVNYAFDDELHPVRLEDLEKYLLFLK